MSMNTIRDYLLESYKPKAILLHGSHARNEAAAGSDYDIKLIFDEPTEIFAHIYEGAMLDITCTTSDKQVLCTDGGTPLWPLIILYDDVDELGKQALQATEKAYVKGPDALSAQEWENRSNYCARLIQKTASRGADINVRHYYLADFYMRVVRYWFEKRCRWNMSAYLAVPLIRQDDPEFFEQLEAIWTEDYLAAMQAIEGILFKGANS